jgi:hypothetical protein
MFKPGIAEFEIEGIKRGFRNSTWAKAVACEELGNKRGEKVTVDRLDQEIGLYDPGKDKDGNEIPRVIDLTALMYFYYGCAVAYHESKKLPIDFKPSDVSDWLDELGEERLTEITKSLFKVPEIKNVQTPEVGTPG